MGVFVANEQSEQPVDEQALAGLARLALDAEGVAESELSILVVDRAVMTDLNERFMGERRPTDVLAFPIDGPSPASGPPPGPTGPAGGPPGPGGVATGAAGLTDEEAAELDEDEPDDDDEPWLLGDVVLCPGYAAEQAGRLGRTLATELELLTVHGILHLCGLDHADPDEERVMTARTEELLARWRTAPDPAPGDSRGAGSSVGGAGDG